MDVSPSTRPNTRLRQERVRRNWRQQDLADQLGTTVVTIKRWERGSQQPSAYFRVKLCALLGKSAEELGLFPENPLSAVPAETAADTPVDTRSTSSASYRLWSVPYQRNLFFTGRETILQQMHIMLSREQVVAQTRSLAISGLAGIGKTQIVLEYAYRHAQDFDTIFWIRAEATESLASSFSTIAELLDLPAKQEHNPHSVIQAVTHWLRHHHNWLLIFDNVDDSLPVKDVLPPLYHGGTLLFTSRSQILGLSTSILDLEPMQPEEGMRFLLYRGRRLNPASALDLLSPADILCAQELVTTMGGLPLALDQAGAYIDETNCSLMHYRTLYQAPNSALLDRRGRPGDYPHSVMMTLSISLQQVEARSPAAADLLRLCAFIDPDAIPEELFLQTAAATSPTPISCLALDARELDEILAILRCYSLIKRYSTTGLLSVHRLVQTTLKAQMDPQTYHYWAQRTIEAVNCAFSEVEVVTTWAQCQRLLPHALICTTFIEEEHFISEDAEHLLRQMGNYLMECSQYKQAEVCLLHAREIFLQRPESTQLEGAENLHALAELAYHQGHYSQAEQFHLQALHIRQKYLGTKHPDIATSLNNLAGVYWIQGQYEQAEPFYRQALQMREETLGSNHLDVGETLQNMAYLFFDQGRYSEAEPLYLYALRICEQVLGSTHTYLTTIFNNLGKLYQAQGKYDDAKDLYMRAKTICDQNLDPWHTYHTMTLSNLAGIASAEGEMALAETLYYQTLQLRKQTLGQEHPRTAQSQYLLAVFYHECGQGIQALPLYQQALVVQEKILGVNHPDTVKTRRCYQQLRLDPSYSHSQEIILSSSGLTFRLKKLKQSHLRRICLKEYVPLKQKSRSITQMN